MELWFHPNRETGMSGKLLRPGETVWRCEHAHRAAVLIDAAAYFGALRSAMLKARSRIFILGWDIHSRTPLVGESGKADDGYPEAFGDFLSALVKEKRHLRVHVLLWDFAVLYAAERELFPTYALRWTTPRGVQFSLDDAVPVGSSQHQKVIVIDDAVAFTGGLDVTIRRWDTSKHEFENALRHDPQGKPYPPFHDVQAVVDGDAARALARLARARWDCACGERVPLLRHQAKGAPADPWPDNIIPDFEDISVAIVRTQPPYEAQKEVREVEALFLESIARAEHTIYIENQFLSCMPIARALAKRLREKPELELLIVAPGTHESWLEARSMRNGRIRFTRELAAKDIAARVRVVCPRVTQGGKTVNTMVHSKVMAIDDCFLRVGSANLNNRSMGTDTECDLFIEARNKPERAAVTAVRNRLIADHCGCRPEQVAAAIALHGSLIKASEKLHGNGHKLCPIDDGTPDNSELAAAIEGVADPEHPILADEFVNELFGNGAPSRRVRPVFKVALAGLAILALALAWKFTPLASLVNPKVLGAALKSFTSDAWAPLVVIAAFVGGGLIMFPVTVLIAATAATFGPGLGFLYAGVGAMLSALVTYLLGARFGKKSLRELFGPKLNRIRRRIARKGIIAIATVRLIPLAPFTVVNLVAGASDIRLSQYLIGTMIGMLPGILVLSVLGHQISQIVLHPSAGSVALLAAAVAGWIALSIGVQALVTKYGKTDY